jgi:hypothetical protein
MQSRGCCPTFGGSTSTSRGWRCSARWRGARRRNRSRSSPGPTRRTRRRGATDTTGRKPRRRRRLRYLCRRYKTFYGRNIQIFVIG